MSGTATKLRRDADVLHELCGQVHRAIGRGEGKLHALRRIARRNKGRVLRNGKVLRPSERTLRRHYDAWLKVQSAAAFPAQVGRKRDYDTARRMFVAACLHANVTSMTAAIRLVRGAQPSIHIPARFYRLATPAERKAVKALHLGRKLVAKLEREARERLVVE